MKAGCPRCGSALELVVDGLIGDRRAPFLACSGCEFCEEVLDGREPLRSKLDRLDFEETRVKALTEPATRARIEAVEAIRSERKAIVIAAIREVIR